MTKIMLVEDDNNLREIYEARLAAEGYDIVSAQDGEAALALAAKEHPDLVITDVMMPKISGFEMLDILRNTEALRDVKVIMLTALGQAEDNARANSLGADRYLVKSQVTLEDIVKATHEVLEPATVPAPAPEANSWQAGVADETAAVQASAAAATPAEPIVASVPPAADITPLAPAETEPVDQVDAVDPAANAEPASVSQPPAAEAPQFIETPTADNDMVSPVAAQLDLPTVPSADDSSSDSPLDLAGIVDDAPSTTPTPTADASPSDTPLDNTADDTSAVSADAVPTDDTSTVSSDAFVAATPNLPIFEPAVATTESSHPQPETATAQPEIAAATPAAEEESVMRDQIDEFLGNLTPSSEAALPTDHADQTDVTPQESQTDSDNPDLHTPPTDEPESEYAKDDSAPDMGMLDIHTDAPEIPEETNAQTPDDSTSLPSADIPLAPTYPSQSYDLSTMPSAVIDGTTSVAPPQGVVAADQSAGDKLVSDAINDMVAASSPTTAPAPVVSTVSSPTPLEQPEVTAPPLEQPSNGASTPPAAPSNDSTTSTQNIVARKRVIAPLHTTSRPDINQLLALEDAKAAATQAGGIVSPTTQTSPDSGSMSSQTEEWQPLPVADQPRSDQYGPGVDPNSISL